MFVDYDIFDPINLLNLLKIHRDIDATINSKNNKHIIDIMNYK